MLIHGFFYLSNIRAHIMCLIWLKFALFKGPFVSLHLEIQFVTVNEKWKEFLNFCGNSNSLKIGSITTINLHGELEFPPKFENSLDFHLHLQIVFLHSKKQTGPNWTHLECACGLMV